MNFARLRELASSVHRRFVDFLQRLLLPAGLWAVYFLVLGATWLLTRAFRPRELHPPDREAPSFWRDAAGGALAEEDALRES